MLTPKVTCRICVGAKRKRKPQTYLPWFQILTCFGKTASASGSLVFGSFVKRQGHVLQQNPALMFQQTINEPDNSPVFQAAEFLSKANVTKAAVMITKQR
jgi:hypothetical protein